MANTIAQLQLHVIGIRKRQLLGQIVINLCRITVTAVIDPYLVSFCCQASFSALTIIYVISPRTDLGIAVQQDFYRLVAISYTHKLYSSVES